ncbi:MAG: hypothetical protein U0003_03095 [Vampirovibrionales bacterium]
MGLLGLSTWLCQKNLHQADESSARGFAPIEMWSEDSGKNLIDSFQRWPNNTTVAASTGANKSSYYTTYIDAIIQTLPHHSSLGKALNHVAQKGYPTGPRTEFYFTRNTWPAQTAAFSPHFLEKPLLRQTSKNAPSPVVIILFGPDIAEKPQGAYQRYRKKAQQLADSLSHHFGLAPNHIKVIRANSPQADRWRTDPCSLFPETFSFENKDVLLTYIGHGGEVNGFWYGSGLTEVDFQKIAAQLHGATHVGLVVFSCHSGALVGTPKH